MSKDIALIPLVNEKTYDLSKSKNVFVFKTEPSFNKHSIKKAVESQFEVEVTDINVLNSKGKVKRTISLTGKRSKNSSGRRKNTKKFYVTIKAGQSLPIFESIDEEQQKRQKTQEQFDKAITKQNQKEAKKVKEPLTRRFRLNKNPESK
jgi:large subunit ribosomal protein L23